MRTHLNPFTTKVSMLKKSRFGIPLAQRGIPLFALAVGLAGCGGGGGGGGGGNPAPGPASGGGGSVQAYDVVTTAVVSGADQGWAVGDTGIILLTGTLPDITHIAHPIITPVSAPVVARTATLNWGYGDVDTIRIDSATQATVSISSPIYDSSTGNLTLGPPAVVTDALSPRVAPASGGLYRAVVSSVVTGDALVGDTLSAVVTPPGFLGVSGGIASLTPMVKDGSTWRAQASDVVGPSVVSGSFSFATTFASATYVERSGLSITQQYTLSVLPAVLPATIASAKVDVHYPGSAPGYLSTSYPAAQRPLDSSVTVSVNATAGSFSLGSRVYVIDDFEQSADGSSTLSGIRFYSDSALTTVDKRVVEFAGFDLSAGGVVTDGYIGYSLWIDPTPTNIGLPGEGNDDFLGYAEFETP